MSGLTRDDIIRMAREAGITFVTEVGVASATPEWLERFAALVAAAERNRTWTQDHWTEYERSIAAAEREACAKVCEQMGVEGYGTLFIAAAIRAREQQENG